MKRDEEFPKMQTTATSPLQNLEMHITSASVENAHATGDGAVKKTDELDPCDENEESTTESTPY
ncbi:hypothetical protein [Flavisolibacter tropicus]|uniref:Uncharacterized protein n=1 Tax=Flavisolibacter tropicus TaxID=1492898 RepID=A0A172TSN8_9BACT|nr:hypothetical protein [Flavisolibacter tropicus]ANE49797.1 hypothetical protein SY85_04100 [Flavisolibacter tropicus]